MIRKDRIVFIKSAASAEGFLESEKPRIVFAGRSNVGKSSVINRLAGRKNLARVGNTPGKTVHINYFDADGAMLWVDMPGYGYAKVSRSEKERWGELMEGYFAAERGISLGVLIVDCRHKPTDDDVVMYRYFVDRAIPCAVVANKCDKVRPSELAGCLSVISEKLGVGARSALLPFSAEKGTGSEELWKLLEEAAARGSAEAPEA